MSDAGIVLVIADPPHGDVSLAGAAVALGAPADELRLKLGFQAPEIFVATDSDRAADVAESLGAAGVSVAVREGQDLTRIPWPALVSSLELGPASMVLHVGTESLDVPYAGLLLAVHCAPPDGFMLPPEDRVPGGEGSRGGAATGALEWVAHVDLYCVLEGALQRFSLTPGTTQRSGGEVPGGDPGLAVASTLAELRRRVGHLPADERLVGVRPRRRFVAGGAGFDMDQRRRYAFGTLLLRHTLESISEDLRDLTQYELGSRLAFVLSG